jgi:hypothetical protein
MGQQLSCATTSIRRVIHKTKKYIEEVFQSIKDTFKAAAKSFAGAAQSGCDKVVSIFREVTRRGGIFTAFLYDSKNLADFSMRFAGRGLLLTLVIGLLAGGLPAIGALAWIHGIFLSAFITGPCILCALIATFTWALIPSGTWFFDANLFKNPSWNYIGTRILKAFGRAGDRLKLLLRGFARGLIPKHKAFFIGVTCILISIASFFTAPGAISGSIANQLARLVMAVYCFSRDPCSRDQYARAKAWVDSMIDKPLSWVGLDGNVWAHRAVYIAFLAALGALDWSTIKPLLSTVLEGLPTFFWIRRSDYNSWTDPNLFWSVVVRLALLASGAMLYKLRQSFDKEVEIREREEHVLQNPGSTRGHPIWISQRATNGSMNHQIMIINGIKYELTLNEDSSATPEFKDTEFRHLNHEDRIFARENGVASVGDFYVYLVGWTHVTHENIVAIGRRKIATWSYGFISDNCITFLRELVDDIVETKASDWDFFRSGKKTPYQVFLFSRKKYKLPFTIIDWALIMFVPGYNGFRLIFRL